ncbi:MAG: DUF3500 domain-containing protein [Cyclobacteriaceae bacterium]
MRLSKYFVSLALLMFIYSSGLAGKKSKIVNSAESFIASLDKSQKDMAMFRFDDKDRTYWTFLPAQNRSGLPLKKMQAKQKDLIFDFLQVHLSEMGLKKTQSVIALEQILFDIEKDPKRDTEKYFISFFGNPSSDKVWAWSFEGHHVSLNFTVVNGKISSSPQFLGANPAEVRTGKQKGLRVLKTEEELAYELMGTFSEDQKKQAIISPKTFGEIVTRFESEVEHLGSKGVSAGTFNDSQKKILKELIDVYILFLNDELAAKRTKQVKANGLENLVFAWAGSTERGNAHYYRIQGSDFLIEFDNSQNNGNHIHTAWRDFDGDFGRDLIKEHYQNSDHH